ncbi:hypothetical protein ACV22V_29895, partial [Burkholderia sp. AW33-5]
RDTGLPRRVNFRFHITNRKNAMTEITKPSPEQLRETIKRHGLTRGEAAQLVHASITAWHAWSAPEGSSNHRPMPLAAWELLLVKLGEHPDYGPRA